MVVVARSWAYGEFPRSNSIWHFPAQLRSFKVELGIYIYMGNIIFGACAKNINLVIGKQLVKRSEKREENIILGKRQDIMFMKNIFLPGMGFLRLSSKDFVCTYFAKYSLFPIFFYFAFFSHFPLFKFNHFCYHS